MVRCECRQGEETTAGPLQGVRLEGCSRGHGDRQTEHTQRQLISQSSSQGSQRQHQVTAGGVLLHGGTLQWYTGTHE